MTSRCINEEGAGHERTLFARKAKRLAIYCQNNRLDGLECLYGMKMSRLASIYDGIGPNWSWGVIARIVEHIDPIFEPAAFIQDVQYRVCPDRSEESFHAVNRQFYDNCVKCVTSGTKWWQWLRRRRLLKSAKILFVESEMNGYESWHGRGVVLDERV